MQVVGGREAVLGSSCLRYGLQYSPTWRMLACQAACMARSPSVASAAWRSSQTPLAD